MTYTLFMLAALTALGAGPGRKSSTVTITARDYTFDAPDTIAAGVTTIHFVNQGPDLHHAILVRLDNGHTVADFAAAMKGPEGPPPAWATFVGGPNAPAPAGDALVTLDLAPGQYVLMCVIPTKDGTPHVMKGMVRPLTVIGPTVGPTAAHSLPKSDVTLTLSDYAFSWSQPLTAGQHVIHVRNVGSQAHEVELVRLAPGRTVHDLIAWVDTRDGPPPAQPLGGVSPMRPGGEAVTTVDLTPGTYGVICFVPDAKDGKPHHAHGMTGQFVVGASR
jgi:plastocyanin